MNAIHLIGRLTKDPDMRYLPGTETASTNFQIAVRRNFKNREGKYDSDFIQVQVLGKPAEAAANYLRKGNRCAVDGRLQIDNWKDDKSGEWKSFTKVIATNVEFLESANSTPSIPEDSQYNPPEGFGDDIGYNTVDDDDVPF